MPGPIPSFQLLNVLLDAMLDDLGKRIVLTFADAVDILPQQLPRRAEFGPDDIGEVSRAVQRTLEPGLNAVRDSLLGQFGQAITRFTAAPDFDVSTSTLGRLSKMVQGTAQRVTELGGRRDEEIKRILGLAVRKPLSAVELADELRSSLKGEGQYARTMVETELKAAQRLLAVNAGRDNGFDRFGYLGPNDPFTRPFCDHMVGWFYTLDMLEACDNDQLPDVVLTLGGYNCRHSLAPATEGMVRRTFPGKLVLEWHAIALSDGNASLTVVAVDRAE